MAACGNRLPPSSSTAITDSASGVLAAAANTEANPTPAPSASGNPSRCESKLPSVAPTKNNGVFYSIDSGANWIHFFPDLIGGNINGPVIMMAEKASDYIRGLPPLAPISLGAGATRMAN